MTQTPCLETGRLTIRRFRPADADDLYEYLSDPLTFRFERGEPVDREQASQRSADMAASADQLFFGQVVFRHELLLVVQDFAGP